MGDEEFCVRRRPHGAQPPRKRHARRIATAAGTANTKRKNGISSATEYPTVERGMSRAASSWW
jgi:hypothetical protein